MEVLNFFFLIFLIFFETKQNKTIFVFYGNNKKYYKIIIKYKKYMIKYIIS